MKKHILVLALLTCSFGLFAQTWTPSTGILYADPTTTKVGIGVSDPITALDVNGNILTSMTGFFGFRRERSGSTTVPISLISRQTNATTGYSDIQIGSGSGEYWHGLTDIYGGGYLGIRIKYNDNNGVNVGIGTTTPGAKLDVNGSLNVSGIINFGSTAVSSSSNLAVTSGLNGSIVTINVNGRGGLKSMASFGYDAGTQINSNFTVNGNSYFTGNVGIGCSNPSVKLAVNGKIQASEVEIKSGPCSDYVFEKNYKLMSLAEVEKFVTTNKHLPEVPSAKEFEQNGYNIGQMDDVLLRKVEELTLYVIEQNKRIEALEKENKALKNK